MKEIELKINERALFERIIAESGIAAQIKEDTGQPSHLSTRAIITEDDKSLIDDYIATAISECVIAINHNLAPCMVVYDYDPSDIRYKTHRLCINVPDNYPEEAVTSLEDIIKNIAINRCLQQWYMLVKCDDLSSCSLKTQLYMQLLHEALTLRKKPL